MDRSEPTLHWQELADAVWLSAYWNRTGRRAPSSVAESVEDSEPGDGTPPAAPTPPLGERPEPPSDESVPISRPLPAPDPEGLDQVHLGPPILPRPDNTAASGRQSAQLARALHRLARRVPSPIAVELDEEVTAERGVSDELWMPWFQPATAAAFDLVLLIDDAPTMEIWRESTRDLTLAAEHCGAFRAVRVVGLDVPRAGQPTLRWGAGQTTADLGEILSGRGDRVFLIVTDGLAHGWAGPAADQLLERLGRAGPTAILHLLPPYVRHRSSLYPYRALLEAGGTGAPNQRLAVRPPWDGPDPLRPFPEPRGTTLPVPVLSLKPGSIAAWGELVTGEPGLCRELPTVLAGTLAKGAPAPGLRAPHHPRAATAAVRRFFTLATPTARRLATQLAAIPFEFDIIDELRKRTLPESAPEHLAEIIMGGLIDWGGFGTEPDFAEGVREALLATTTRSQLAVIVSILGELPAAGARGVALRAALRDPAGTTLPDPGSRGWHHSELAVMRALSGPYSERARRMEENNSAVDGSLSSPEGLQADAPTQATAPEVENGARSDRTGNSTEARPGMEMNSAAGASSALLVNVPLRNMSFVGRVALLEAVEEQLAGQDTAAVLPHALHGMGGVGKSQLALEYVYRHQQDYKVICWIPAERETLILTALSTLAERMRLIPGGQDSAGAPAANTAVPAVLEALGRGAPYDNWLLVFDNAENVEAVRSYFPANGPGKIIVTSRNREWERVATPLPVNVFERAESIELLQKRSPDLSEGDADRLAAALGDLPLAVEQAGAWRAVTGMLVDDYLELLNRRSPEILNLDPAPDYPVSVAAVWDISLERIKENNPGARELLDICACMAPEPIPLSMLRKSRGIDITPEVDPILRESIKLGRAIRALTQFSLVKLDLRYDTLQMHRLLQNVLLAKLGSEEHERMRNAAHQLLSAAKPGHYASSQEWAAYQTLLPHVLSSQTATSANTYVRELVDEMVLFLYYWGDHQSAVDFARQAYDARLRASGEENIGVIRISKILAFLLRVVGEAGQSIGLNEKALENSRRIEVDEEDLIDSLIELADARRYQGRFEEARDLGQEATERARTQLGLVDEITLRAAHSWGVDLRLCGQYDEALRMDQETARLREEVFGPTNSLTLNTLNGLSIDMRESGDYSAARLHQEDVYRRARAALGEENPLTLRIARDLAVCRRRDGALADAAKLAEQVLRQLTTAFGSDHTDTMLTAINVTVDRRLARDLDRSRLLGEDTLRRLTRRYGEAHGHTLLARANLAATLLALDDLDGAQRLEDEAARGLADTVGSRHVAALTVNLGRANAAYTRFDFERAREIDQTTLPLLAEMAGADHPLTLSCTANLALDLRGLARGAEADEMEDRAVEGFARVVREDHPWLTTARRRRRIQCDLAPMPL